MSLNTIIIYIIWVFGSPSSPVMSYFWFCPWYCSFYINQLWYITYLASLRLPTLVQYRMYILKIIWDFNIYFQFCYWFNDLHYRISVGLSAHISTYFIINYSHPYAVMLSILKFNYVVFNCNTILLRSQNSR